MIPKEADEQKTLVHYLTLRNIPHFRVPNETYTTSWKQKTNNRLLGVSRGVPDLFIVVGGKVIAIEMKRVKKATVSLEQKQWLEILNANGLPAYVCYGATEAIALVEKLNK